MKKQIAFVAVVSLFAAAVFAADTAQNTDSKDLIANLLSSNEAWLKPRVRDYSYSFTMRHPGQFDGVTYKVQLRGRKAKVIKGDSKADWQTIGNEYDPNNSATPPQLITLQQATTFFGPLQELALNPGDFALSMIGTDTLDGKQAVELQLRPTGPPSDRAIERRNDSLKQLTTQPRYQYELTPAIEETSGSKHAVLRARCLFEEGPNWKKIQSNLKEQPSRLIWDEGRMSKGDYRAFLLKTKSGEIPMILVWGWESGHYVPSIILSEGESITRPELMTALEDVVQKPERWISMRFGCGIWHTWYGYSGGGAKYDKIWTDPVSGAVLREEGYGDDGRRNFTIQYSGHEKNAHGKSFPRHILITTESREKQPPWVMDMTFDLHGGELWLMKTLKLNTGAHGSEASVSNVKLNLDGNGR